MVHGPLDWFIGGKWKSLALWAREALECCKQGFMGHSAGDCGSPECREACIGCFQGGEKTLLGTGPVRHSCSISSKETGYILSVSCELE